MNKVKRATGTILIICLMVSMITSCLGHKTYKNSLVLDFKSVIRSYDLDEYDVFNGVNSGSWANFSVCMNRVAGQGYTCNLYAYRFVSFEDIRDYVEALKASDFEQSEIPVAGCQNVMEQAPGAKLDTLLCDSGFCDRSAVNDQLYHSEDSLWLVRQKGRSVSYAIVFRGQLQGEENDFFILVISK